MSLKKDNWSEMLGIKCLDDIRTMCAEGMREKDTMIQKALDHHSLDMLHVNKFISITGFQLGNLLPLNLMWNSFRMRIPIYITDELIETFGYKGTPPEQKRNILKLVKKYEIPIIRLNNEEYQEFTHEPQLMPNNSGIPTQKSDDDILEFYPTTTTKQLKSKPTHNLIMPRDLKKLMIVVNTANGNMIREYVIALDELINLYLTYQKKRDAKLHLLAEQLYKIEIEKSKVANENMCAKMEKLSSENGMMCVKMEKLTSAYEDIKESLEVNQEILVEVNDKFDRSTDERAPRTSSITKREVFIIVRLNKPDYEWAHYAIRCQHTSARRTLKKLEYKYPNMAELLRISYQPNSKNLFNLMKEKLMKADRKIAVKHNNIKLSDRYSESAFIQDIRALDLSKKDVDSDDESE